MPAPAVTNYQYGVEIIEGLPGSGKSYFAVKRVMRVCLEQARPVYTNLPLKWSKCRAYLRLKGDDARARLLYRLERDHFDRFMVRFAQYQAFRESCKDFRATARMTDDEIKAAFLDQHGPDITQGKDANWIPATAVIVIDEAQLWYPMRHKPEGGDVPILKYLSMHRHLIHWLWFITQERGRIDINIRKMAAKVWRVRDMAKDHIAWFIRGEHLGIKAFGYACWSGEQLEGSTTKEQQNKPLENYVDYPWWPGRNWPFRLYDSFTNAASAQELENVLKAERVKAGVAEIAPRLAKNPETRRSQMFGGIVKGTLIGLFALILFCAGCLLQANRNTPVDAGVKVVGQVDKLKWGRWQGSGPGFAMVDGRRIAQGEKHANGSSLMGISPDGKSSLWLAERTVWLWVLGDTDPRLLGDVGLVGLALRSEISSRGRAAEQGPGVSGAAAVEPPAGQPPR